MIAGITTESTELATVCRIEIFTDELKKFRKNEKIIFDFYDNSKCIFSINVCFKEIIDGIYNTFNVDQESSPIILRDFKST